VRIVTTAAGQLSVPSQNFLGDKGFFGLYSHWMALHEFDGCDPFILIVTAKAQGIGPAHRQAGPDIFLNFVGSYTEGEVSLGLMEAMALRAIVIVRTGSVNDGRRRENRQGGKKEESPSHRVLLVNGSEIGISTVDAQIGISGSVLQAIARKGN
jgi:hypothetical protein